MRLYAIAENVDGGLIKIGVSRNVGARLKMLQTGAARPLVLLGDVECYRYHASERYAHYLLRDSRAGGEWFAVSREMALSIIHQASDETAKSEWSAPWLGEFVPSIYRVRT